MKSYPLARTARKTQNAGVAAYNALRRQVEETLLLGQRKIEQAKVQDIIAEKLAADWLNFQGI